MLRLMVTSLIVVLMGFGCGGGENSGTSASTNNTEAGATSEPDHALGESNIKYDALEAMEARGAVAPVIEDFTCNWSATTVADCTGTGYDVAAEQSSCGYPLLPCGNYDVIVHAECSDGEGHDCQAELELVGTG